MSKRSIWLGCVYLLAAVCLASCAAAPKIQPVTEAEPSAPAPAAFFMQPYHEDMMAEMRLSFESSDEIIFGLYAGSHKDEQFGLIHYFEDFSSFDKATMLWGSAMKVIVQVQANELKPEIITRKEYPRLSDLDKVGICWDSFERVRYVYLVEGKKMLLFLQTGYDEVNNRSYRKLIDAYPETPICRARGVFDLMIRNLHRHARDL